MRDPDRMAGVLAELWRIWAKYPDLRLGQLLINVAPESEIYNIEDDELLERLIKHYEENR